MQIVNIIVAALIALGLAVAGFCVERGLVSLSSDNHYVAVKGLAERDVQADTAVWYLSFSAKNLDMSKARSALLEDEKKIMDFLQSSGIPATEVSIESLSVSEGSEISSRTGGSENYEKFFYATQTLVVRTKNVNNVAQAAQKTSILVDQGVLVKSERPRYIFTKLNDIKPDMIGEATRNARKAADQFAKDSGNNVGPMITATQGWFNILARDGSDEDSEAYFIDKKVRVITDINFVLMN